MASAVVVIFMYFPRTPCRFFQLSVSKSAELLHAYGLGWRISLDGVHLEDADLSDMSSYPVEQRLLPEDSISETALPYSPHTSLQSETSELSDGSSLVLAQTESQLSSYEYARSSSEQFPLTSTPFSSQINESRFQHIMESSLQDINESDYNFNLSNTMKLSDSRSTEVVESMEIKHVTIRTEEVHAGLLTDMEEGDGISDKWEKEMSQRDIVTKE